MKRVDKALAEFYKGFACSQAVVAAFAEDLGIDVDTALGLACGFGGGIGRQGGLCGAVSGAVMVLGYKYGMRTGDEKEKKGIAYQKVRDFYDAFLAENSSVNCSGLLGFDVSEPEDRKIIKEKNLKRTICSPAITDAVHILEKILKDA